MKELPYIPVNCSFYDELEALATLRKVSAISFLDQDGTTQMIKGKIIDFFIHEKAEYLKMDSGKEIRLDRILSVNGNVVPQVC